MSRTARALAHVLVLLVACAGVVAAALAPSLAAAATTPPPRPLVVIGVGGLTWDDVDSRMPRLAVLAGQGATADLVTRTVQDTTCPTDGWLSLGAGSRAASPAPCRPLVAPLTTRPGAKGKPLPMPATIPGWAKNVEATKASLSGAHLGSLGTALRPKGQCVSSVGAGAAHAVADRTGVVPGYLGLFSPAAVRTGITQCGVTIVDVGTLDPRINHTTALRDLDARVGQVLDAAGPTADVVLASVSDPAGGPRLAPVVVRAPGFSGHRLDSPSTRQPGLVLLTDLAPTITSLRGLPADAAWSGDALRAGPAVPADERIAAHRDLDLLGLRAKPLVAPLVVAWIVLQLLCYAGVWLAWRFGMLDSPRARRAGAAVAVLAASWPAATFLARLVPWWRTDLAPLLLPLVTLVFSATIAALALYGPFRRHPLGPLAVVSAVTVLVIMADVATGSHLMISAMIGEHPVVGGRFYGLGNASSGILAAATLLLMTALIERGDEERRARRSALLALAIGLAVVLFTAAPQLGADFGGPAALLPAVLYLSFRGLGLRLDAGRVVVLGFLLLGLLMAVCLLDWLRPAPQRTHLGRFAESVISGTGGDVIGRKLIQNWHIFTSTPLTMILPFVTLAIAYCVWRPRRVPGRPFTRTFAVLPVLRVGLLSVFIMLFLAMLMNDSGATVPAPVGLLVVPLVIATMLLAPLTWDARRGATRRTTAPAPRTDATTSEPTTPAPVD